MTSHEVNFDEHHTPILMSYQGLFYTRTESHDYENLRAFENHQKAIAWQIESNFAIDGPSMLQVM